MLLWTVLCLAKCIHAGSVKQKLIHVETPLESSQDRVLWLDLVRADRHWSL
jgi:hypothetical protein